MREVADAAGVSVASVSRVLTGTRPVSPDIAQRVRAAAERLGYRRNLLASGLRGQRSATFGALVPNLAEPRYGHLIDAFSRRLQQAGRALLVGQSRCSDALTREGLLRLLDRSVDAVVVVPCVEHPVGDLLEEVAASTHVIVVERRADLSGVDVIGVDEVDGVRQVLAHLAAVGRHRSLLLAGSELAGGLRQAAYLDAVLEGRTEAVAAPVRAGHGVALGRRIAADIDPDGVDVLICDEETAAFGVLDGLRRRGVRVPDDLAVASWGGGGLAELASPGLTSVTHPVEAIAAALLDRVDTAGGVPLQPPITQLLAPTLVVRGSTDADDGGHARVDAADRGDARVDAADRWPAGAVVGDDGLGWQPRPRTDAQSSPFSALSSSSSSRSGSSSGR